MLGPTNDVDIKMEKCVAINQKTNNFTYNQKSVSGLNGRCRTLFPTLILLLAGGLVLLSCNPLKELTELSNCRTTFASDSLSLESPTDGLMSFPNIRGARPVLGLVSVMSDSVSESFMV